MVVSRASGRRPGRAGARALPSDRPVFAALAVLAALAAFAAAQQARAQATEPERMKGVEALAGDQRVHLFWEEPDDGGSPLLRYEYRYRSTGEFPATWTEVPDGLDIPVIEGDLPPIRYLLPDRFANGTAYTFQMRAVNAVGASDVDADSEATAMPAANNPASGMVRLFNEERPQGELRPGGRVILNVDDGQGNLLVQDADGLTHAAVGRNAEEYFRFRHYWYRVAGGTETLVAEDTVGPGLEGGYQFTDADVGARFRVVTRFIDDRGNPEEVSTEYPPSGAILPAAECRAPAHTGGATRIWTGMLRVRAYQDGGTITAYGTNSGSTFAETGRGFTAGGNAYTVDGAYRAVAGPMPNTLVFSLTSALAETDRNRLALHVCDQEYRFAEATEQPGPHHYRWGSELDWSTIVYRTLYLSYDDAAPTLTGGTLSGASLILTFSEELDPASVPPLGAFSATVNGADAAFADGSVPAIDGRTVTLTFAGAPAPRSRVAVSYAAPAPDPALRDLARNAVAGIAERIVVAPPPVRPQPVAPDPEPEPEPVPDPEPETMAMAESAAPWLMRFGRTAAGQVAEALAGRLAAPPSAGLAVSLG
ncbi:MAG: SwmB domain-containing protein, partial [Defluviicoccus sp.]|nr:SwmB domain-containing protein [Defluviicoccus sp.]